MQSSDLPGMDSLAGMELLFALSLQASSLKRLSLPCPRLGVRCLLLPQVLC
jgi:hypothetical protein